MMNLIRDIYGTIFEFVRTFGAFQLFFLRLIRHSPRMILRRPRLVIKQIYNSGALSLVIIMVCGFFVGGVLGLQGYANLARFNAEDSVGTVVAMALLKELGPVITALLFAGRAGTALCSEIGLMKATDQLSAMEMMAVNPVRRVLVPRFLGGVVAMPFLAAIFTSIGLFGAHLVAVDLLSVDVGAFWQQMQFTVAPDDIREGIFKSIVFGIVASLVARSRSVPASSSSTISNPTNT